MEKKTEIVSALNLAVEKQKQGKLREAEVIYKNILETNPKNSNALHLLGLVFYQQGDYESSAEMIKKAIQSNPNIALYHGNLGMVLDLLGKEEESTSSFKKALKIDSDYPNSHLAKYNIGVSLANEGKLAEALEYYDKAIKADKTFFDARWNKSLILLLLGKFEEGWKEYESRFNKKNPADSRILNKPQWDGSYIGSKKLLILSEQGFGDNIQFIRYLPLVKEKTGKIILECKKELKQLFENLPVDELIEKNNDVDFDFYIHIMSLPRIFNTNFNNLPKKVPYLKANPELVEKYKKEKNTPNFKIGINWAGNPNQENDKNRSTTFEKFKILTKIPNVTFFSLQKGEAAKQLDNSEVINIEKDTKDFSDTAAIIENLDLVISVDTSVAHLAGALGKPVWVLLSHLPDWRWFLNRSDSPWYPTMRLFRQKKINDWDSLLSEVLEEIKKTAKIHSYKII